MELSLEQTLRLISEVQLRTPPIETANNHRPQERTSENNLENIDYKLLQLLNRLSIEAQRSINLNEQLQERIAKQNLYDFFFFYYFKPVSSKKMEVIEK